MSTWRDLWLLGASHLRRQGNESAQLDAELLLRHLAARDQVQFYRDLSETCPDDAWTRYQEMLNRRAQGTPVAYLIGEKEFYGLSLQVSPAVLIPRPETEILVERALELFQQALLPPASWVLDVGTGSGAIAVALASQLPRVQIMATDISVKALVVAAANAGRHGLTARVHFEAADLWPSAQHLDRLLIERPGFGLVVSNPPYIESAAIGRLAPEVRQEPELALDGGQDGLKFYSRLIADLKSYIVPGGWVLLEVGAGQADQVSELLAAAGFGVRPAIPDLAGHPRVVQAVN